MADWFPPFWASQTVELFYLESGQYVNGLWVNGTYQQISIDGVILDRPSDDLEQLGSGNQITRIVDVYFRYSDFFPYQNFLKTDMAIFNGLNFYKVLSFAKRDKVLPHFKLTCECVDRPPFAE